MSSSEKTRILPIYKTLQKKEIIPSIEYAVHHTKWIHHLTYSLLHIYGRLVADKDSRIESWNSYFRQLDSFADLISAFRRRNMVFDIPIPDLKSKLLSYVRSHEIKIITSIDSFLQSINKMKVADMKKECTWRGLATNGNKADRSKRLIEFFDDYDNTSYEGLDVLDVINLLEDRNVNDDVTQTVLPWCKAFLRKQLSNYHKNLATDDKDILLEPLSANEKVEFPKDLETKTIPELKAICDKFHQPLIHTPEDTERSLQANIIFNKRPDMNVFALKGQLALRKALKGCGNSREKYIAKLIEHVIANPETLLLFMIHLLCQPRKSIEKSSTKDLLTKRLVSVDILLLRL